MDKSMREGMSRRALLGAAGGVVVGAVITSAPSARAANGDPLIIGADNEGDTTTLVGDAVPALFVRGTGDDGVVKVVNESPDLGYGIATYGGSATYLARGGVAGVDAAGRDVGVAGVSPHRVGVRGQGGSVGVSGLSTTGVGVKAQAGKAGVALKVTGRSQFTSAGVATIPQGASSAVVSSPVPLSESSLILATPQTAGGVIESASKDVADGTFTLRLVKPATHAVDVAWFVIG